MRHFFHFILLVVILFLSASVYGEGTNRSVKSIPGGLDMSVNPVPTSFDAGNPGSRVLTGLFNYTHILILSTASATCSFAVNTTHDAVAPADSDPGNVDLILTLPGVILDGPYIGPSIYVRTTHGAPCSAGTLFVSVW